MGRSEIMREEWGRGRIGRQGKEKGEQKTKNRKKRGVEKMGEGGKEWGDERKDG